MVRLYCCISRGGVCNYLYGLDMGEHRNADLVKIGVSFLRVDPEKEKQISAAREWELDLIDANASG
ncbi:MAG TPA: hypothetical protein VHT48_07415 [Methylocella sp.]|jgi:hypothetical protein|nr:hypothetical protein [Methylocella sp.]